MATQTIGRWMSFAGVSTVWVGTIWEGGAEFTGGWPGEETTGWYRTVMARKLKLPTTTSTTNPMIKLDKIGLRFAGVGIGWCTAAGRSAGNAWTCRVSECSRTMCCRERLTMTMLAGLLLSFTSSMHVMSA